MLLEGRVAVVSGVGPGMGRDISLALAGAGADLVLGARTSSALEAVGEQVEALGRQVRCVPTDITDPDQCRRLGDSADPMRSTTSAAQAMARELGAHAIRVNCVAPGHIWGRSLRHYFEFLAERRGVTAQAVYDEIAATTALNRIATSEEIARVVLF